MNEDKEMHERNDESKMEVMPSLSVNDVSELQFLKHSSGIDSVLILTSKILLLVKLP